MHHTQDLADFLNQIAPRYGYEFLAIEQNEELNQHLNLPDVPVNKSWCHFAPFGEEFAELLDD